MMGSVGGAASGIHSIKPAGTAPCSPDASHTSTHPLSTSPPLVHTGSPTVARGGLDGGLAGKIDGHVAARIRRREVGRRCVAARRAIERRRLTSRHGRTECLVDAARDKAVLVGGFGDEGFGGDDEWCLHGFIVAAGATQARDSPGARDSPKPHDFAWAPCRAIFLDFYQRRQQVAESPPLL